ncbi:hypothetical protein CSKR_105094 [Clonorchis sinensis]|uniref:Uncharacterized protein n=1 Tax=Clonorchis sinensis TaxID=79923 RepID=A0A419QH03_CLOSI|nr:hypothetical protein CSKR_105094 [Clonorchis sinensis]
MHSAVVTVWRLAVMQPEGSTRVRILPGCPSLDRGSRVAEVGFEPRIFRSVNSRSKHLSISPVILITLHDVAYLGYLSYLLGPCPCSALTRQLGTEIVLQLNSYPNGAGCGASLVESIGTDFLRARVTYGTWHILKVVPMKREGDGKTSATEFAANGFYTLLPRYYLIAPGSFLPSPGLCEKGCSRKSVNCHTEHATNPVQPAVRDQFICLGRVDSFKNRLTWFGIAGMCFHQSCAVL